MNFLRTLLGTCAGLRFYGLALDWRVADALKYLLKLVVLLTLIAVPLMVRSGLRLADRAGAWIEEQKFLPEFSIEKGRARSSVPQPYVRRAGDFQFILDTTGATTLDAATAPIGVLINGNSLFAWNEFNPRPEPIALAVFPDGHVDAGYVTGLLRMAVWWLAVPAVLAMFLGFGCVALVQVAGFSGMASLMEGWLEPRFRFEQLFCIATLALTPASLVAAAFWACGVWQGWLSFVYLIVFAFYFTSAAAVCRPLLGPAEEREF
ncbi:MAG: DUF1189 domain-containing protein [Verrucomicrobia bacterium]|nr:DUF1189 domain-containing protein [Verrucomicrobiota bacterium]